MNAPLSLCPGYKEVEAFGPEEEYEDEEEVSYVVLDLGNVEPTLVPTSSTYRLIGLDTPTPFLQLQGTIFKGRHDLLLGTELLFTDDKGTHDRNKRVVHVANTEQRIAFKEVTLIPKVPKERETSKGKEKEGTNTVNLEETSKDSFFNIDRIIGLSAPAGRAPRKKKTTPSTSATSTTKPKAKGKEKAGTSKASNAKGKEKEVPTEDVPMDEDAPETNNNIDDIYMDE